MRGVWGASCFSEEFLEFGAELTRVEATSDVVWVSLAKTSASAASGFATCYNVT